MTTVVMRPTSKNELVILPEPSTMRSCTDWLAPATANQQVAGCRRGRPCSVCTHPQAREIATALPAGSSVREVGRRYEISASTLARHVRLHLTARIARAESATGRPTPATDVQPGSIKAEAAAASRVRALESFEAHLDVMRAMRELHARTLALLAKAEASGDVHVALRAVREARGAVDGPSDEACNFSAPERWM